MAYQNTLHTARRIWVAKREGEEYGRVIVPESLRAQTLADIFTNTTNVFLARDEQRGYEMGQSMLGLQETQDAPTDEGRHYRNTDRGNRHVYPMACSSRLFSTKAALP